MARKAKDHSADPKFCRAQIPRHVASPASLFLGIVKAFSCPHDAVKAVLELQKPSSSLCQ
jgi:hypothetical protein